MKTILVVHSLRDWPLEVPSIQVVPARDYLTDPVWSRARGVRVFNLCRTYRYQGEGYYVSLLAEARKHRPLPGLETVLDMRDRRIVTAAGGDLDAMIQRSLADLVGDRFELSVYFGRNLAKRHEALARRLFSIFPAPMLRARFERRAADGAKGAPGAWQMTAVGPIGFKDVPEGHRAFLAESAEAFAVRRPRRDRGGKRAARYDIAVLHDPAEEFAPSDARALARFARAARDAGCAVEPIGKDDLLRLAEFDALFIRETTAVVHHTFRFAQRAAAEGLVVIDDPTSILRCTNKVYQAEALALAGVATPRTLVLAGAMATDVERVSAEVGFPCVLKHPDSSFSQGVSRADGPEELAQRMRGMLDRSDLVVVQEYLPTGFDWRVGVFGGEVLFACKYHMARGHWQIVGRTAAGRTRFGRVEPVPVEEVPHSVLRAAVDAAAVVGNGLYGVDLKLFGDRVVVTEVNDNPNIESGCEDAVLGAALYDRLVAGFVSRIEARRNPAGGLR